MSNAENLIPFDKRTEDEVREIAKIGGISSGKARKRKADLQKVVQAILDGNYNAKNTDTGEVMQLSGAELIAHKLFSAATDEHNKNFIGAVKIIIELTGANKNPLDEKKKKVETDYLKAKTKLLSGADDDETQKSLVKISELFKAVDSVIE